MSIQGSSAVGPPIRVASVPAGSFGATPGAVSPDSSGAASDALARAAQSALPDLGETDAQESAADTALTMPATPLTHMLLQLRAVARDAGEGQHAARQASTAEQRSGGPTKTPARQQRQAGVARAYARVEQITRRQAPARSVDVYDDNG